MWLGFDVSLDAMCGLSFLILCSAVFYSGFIILRNAFSNRNAPIFCRWRCCIWKTVSASAIVLLIGWAVWLWDWNWSPVGIINLMSLFNFLVSLHCLANHILSVIKNIVFLHFFVFNHMYLGHLVLLVQYGCMMRFKPFFIAVTRCLLEPKNFIWYCLVWIFLVLSTRETPYDVYIICWESHYASTLDNTHSPVSGCSPGIMQRGNIVAIQLSAIFPLPFQSCPQPNQYSQHWSASQVRKLPPDTTRFRQCRLTRDKSRWDFSVFENINFPSFILDLYLNTEEAKAWIAFLFFTHIL